MAWRPSPTQAGDGILYALEKLAKAARKPDEPNMGEAGLSVLEGVIKSLTDALWGAGPPRRFT